MIPIDQLLTPVTEDQQIADITSTCVSLGVPADQWRKAGAMSVFRRAVSRTYAALTSLLVQAIGGAWLDTAMAGWLKRLALYVYGIVVPQATFATGKLTLTNSLGGIFSYDPGQATFLNPTTKKTFVNVLHFDLGALATLTIDIIAVEAGKNSTSLPGQINALQTAMLGVTCSNAAAVIGVEAPADADIKAMCRTTLGAASVRGPANAYKFYARFTIDPATGLGIPLTNASGAPVNINRVDVSPASHTGQVTVTVAAPSGAPTSADLTAADANIQAKAVPGAVTETTQAATEVPYTATLTVWAQALQGLSAAIVQTEVEAAIATFLSSYPIAGLAKGTSKGLFGTGIDGVVKAADAAIFAVDGATDLALTAGQVAIDETTVTVRMVKTS